MGKRHFWQRTTALFLGVSLLLSGCGGSGGSGTSQSGNTKDYGLSSADPVTITIWNYYNGPQKLAFDEMVTEFNETVGLEKGIIVEAISHGNINDLAQKVLDAAENKVGASEMPDIFSAYADTAYQLDEMGIVAALEGYLTEEELAAYVDSYVDEGRIGQGDHFKIFPTAKSLEIFLLNKTDWDAFATATGASQEELATWEGLTRVSEAYYNWTDSLTAAPNDGRAFFGRDAMANYMIIGSRQLGMEIFQVKDGIVTFQLDEAVLRKLWNNYYVPYISGYYSHVGRFRSDDAKTGDIISLVGSTSGAAYFPNQVTGADSQSHPIESLALPAPIFAGGTPYAVQQGAGMVVVKSEEKKEYAATLFLKWFTEPERNLLFSMESGYLPVTKVGSSADLIREKVAGQPEVPTQLKNVLPVAAEQVSTHKLYTNQAFKGGTAARAVLENLLTQFMTEDRAAVVELLGNGVSHEEAVARYNTEERFQNWVTALREGLENTQK